MHSRLGVLAAIGVLFLSAGPSAARAAGPRAKAVRAAYDVLCKFTVADGTSAAAGTTVPLKFVVKNRGRRAVRDVTLSVYADTVSGTPLWTEVTKLGAHRRRTRQLHIWVPQTATQLVAVADCDADENPGNNLAGLPVVGGTPVPDPTQPPVVDPAILAGAATYAANCASCHGADAKGTPLGPNLLHRSSGDIWEAMQEGPDEMPTFPDLTRTDASNLAKYLLDPAAATPPAPDPVPPPAPGTPPTYTAQVKPFLDASCVVCHKGASAPKGVKLDTYASASANAATALAALQAGTMPPSSPPSAANVQMFADWIAAGKPQ